MKQCSDCSRNLLESEFNLASTKGRRLQPYCRECQSQHQKDWYKKNGKYRRKQVAERRKAIKAELQEIVYELKRQPCTDCGGCFNPWQMDFDHLRDKKYDVGFMVNSGYSKEVVLEEIAKCELVCSNCHRERTHNRGSA